MDPIAPSSTPRSLQNIFAGGAGAAVAPLPNLTAIIDGTDPSATPRQVIVASGQRIAREYTAYGHLFVQAEVTGNATAYLKAYVSFYDSLSPAEQQSVRYVGTRAAAIKGLAGAVPSSSAASTPSTPAAASAQALGILAAQNQSSQPYATSNGTNWALPNANLLSGLRSLSGIIDTQQHPEPVALRPISPGALDLSA